MNTNVGLQYGAHPPKIAQTIKCSPEEAQIIFDRYHNELYANVTKFREEVVLPYVRQHGEIHMGLGAKLLTDDPKQSERTLVNSCSQFWSILTLLTINKLHQAIDDNNMQNSVCVTNTIYDAIYGEVDNTPQAIKWLNDTLVPIMTAPYLQGEIVHNLCDLEIGTSWADFHTIPNNATLEEITQITKTIYEELP